MIRSLLLLPLCLLAGCATTGLRLSPQAQQSTVAQGVLQRDVVQMLHIASYASNPECQAKKVTSVVVKQESKEGPDGVIEAREIWTLDLCGALSQFRVDFLETPGQGTVFGVTQL